MSFPACCSTSAAGSQAQPEGQWLDLQDPLEICPFTHQPTQAHRGGRARWRHPTPAGPILRKHRTRQVARFWCGLLDLSFLGQYRCLSAANWGRDSWIPSRRFVSPFGTGRVCHLQLLARVMPAGFQQLGGEVLLLLWEPFGNVNWLHFFVVKCWQFCTNYDYYS